MLTYLYNDIELKVSKLTIRQAFVYNGSFLIILICRNFVSDIHAKTGQILNRGSAQQIGGSAGGGYDNTVAIKVHIC